MTAPAEPCWLSIEQILITHEKQLRKIGGGAGVRDLGLLESAPARAENKWRYEHADLPELAAAYAFGIARNHPFVDGNKRVAFLVMAGFLRKNGVAFKPSQAEAAAIILALAAGDVGEEGLTRWIRDNWPKD